ncbi:uncharacterized protein LOC111779131 [Cucurbita pepo subsp. pepo]|uniref:uncharacterized protein LOC111779131 n=1 Tax=Cucurbita pepo subsp. pepo TaxID=3664 RepID=UPI000C9D8821|nr:uncharacterized protein LOC111779131 [Cucurbita pepo subsp. pepo]
MDYHFTRIPYIHMKLLGATLSVNLAPNSAIWKTFYYPVANVNHPSNVMPMNQQISICRNDSLSSPFNVFNRTNSSQSLLFIVAEGRISNSGECYKPKCSSVSFEKQVSSRNIGDDDCPENHETENDKEWQRRRKIGVANKGKVPWNKGKKHSLETRKRIKQRTIEALKNPKVRRKMSEYPRPTHSDQVKTKISSSLRRVWGKRLLKKRLNEAFFQSWKESIAVAAKKGGKGEQEHDWDSHDKIIQEMLHQKLKMVEEKEKLKLMRAENAKKRKIQGRGAKIKKRKMCSRRRKGGKRKMKEGEDIQRTMKELTAIERSGLKQRLKKIRKKIAINSVVAAQGSVASVVPRGTTWEKMDLDLIKKGKLREEVSLADQIQFAKNRKAESIACKILVASTLSYECTRGA